MKTLILLLHISFFTVSQASLPDAEIHFQDNIELCRLASFGSRAPTTGALRRPPSDNPLLCNNSTDRAMDGFYEADTIFLTPRGECTFESKARTAERYGAAGILIYNNLQSRYKWNDTFGEVNYPDNQRDYECSNGQDEITNFPLDPPQYKTDFHDPLLTLANASNMCKIDGNYCTSGRCLVTGPAQSNITTACCAWDISLAMNHDTSLSLNGASNISSIFLTMAQAELFLQLPERTQVRINERSYPKFNASSFLLWLMATAIVAFASWYSAGDYRRAKYKLTHPVPAIQTPSPLDIPMEVGTISGRERSGERPIESATDEENHVELMEQSTLDNEENHGDLPGQGTRSEPMDETGNQLQPDDNTPQQETAPTNIPVSPSPLSNTRSQSPPPQTPPPHQGRVSQPFRRVNSLGTGRTTTNPNGSIELTIWHAALFVVIASGMLLLLFFFEFFTAVAVLYSIGCSGAVSQILFRPLYTRLARLAKHDNCLQSVMFPKIRCCGFDQILWLDLVSGASGYLLGGMWLFVWFTSIDPSSVPFYWITQNIMGTCLCILFLSLLKLNSIMVASVLLFAVFIYDIFFVFITPMFFDSSVMVTVATGGGGPEASADHCEKYPNDNDCKWTILPMLLTIPKINDFRGGANLLGLGDIVLPGLLISFAARLDEAKRLIGGHTTLDIKVPSRGGFLLPLTVAYAVGLLFANLAVVWLDGGQPALLYLVPACLGTMISVGWQELGELWRGPKVIRWADNLVRYCDRHTFVTNSSEDDATVVDSASAMGDDVVSVHTLT